MLCVALPKGRILDSVLAEFESRGVFRRFDARIGRELTVDVPDAVSSVGLPVRLLLLKNADVPTYVEHGVAHAGVCGTDVLEESGANVYRPFTFGFGGCKIAIAGRDHVSFEDLRKVACVRVATKYPRLTTRYFGERGWRVKLIKLSGSVELGASLGLADVIVDLVETGSTLRANQLRILEVIGKTRVKLIAHRGLSPERARALSRMTRALDRERQTVPRTPHAAGVERGI